MNAFEFLKGNKLEIGTKLMDHNYQIIIEYDGTKFVGWQYQKNGISVQEVLENKLTKLLKKK